MSAPSKFLSRQSCIDEIKRIQGKFPDEFISRNLFRIHSGCSETDYERHFKNFSMLRKAAGAALMSDSLGDRQKDVVAVYVAMVDKKGAHPTYPELAAKGLSDDKVRHRFGSFKNLRKMARELHPATFEDILDDSVFNEQQFQTLKAETAKYSRFVITTAITGCPVDKNFLAALKNYCKRNDALLLIMHCTDPAARVAWSLDSALKDEQIITQALRLNSNFFLSTIKMSPKQMDPSTSFARIVQKNGSCIAASPKQRLLPISNSIASSPRVFMTPGAITKPRYGSDRYMSDRTAGIADVDHVMGALVVEIVDDKVFHFRQIQAEKSGNFAEFGKYYRSDTMGKTAPAVISLGDLHVTETDPMADRAWKQIIVEHNIPIVIMHDFLTGVSVSHHEERNATLRAQRFAAGLLSLEHELRECARVANEYCELKPVKKLVFVESNHNEFLARYINENRWLKDPHNRKVSLQLALAMFNAKGEFEQANPVKVGMELFGFKYPEKAVWLSRNDSFKIGGVEYGAHGDQGVNGKPRPSMMAIEQAYGNSVTGHRHYSEIFRGAFSNGTSSLLRLVYNKGVSTWVQTSTIGYDNGQRQIIAVQRDGSYRLR